MMCSLLLRHQERHSRIYNVIEGWIDALTQRVSPRRSRAALHHRWVIVLAWVVVARARRGLLQAAQVGACADRGSRRRLQARHRAAGLDAAVHGGPDQADRGVLRADSRSRRVHGDLRVPDRRRRQRDPAPEAVGGADQEAAADHRRGAAKGDGDSRRARVPDQSAVARPVVPLDAGRIRDHVAGAVCRAAADRRPLSRRGAQVPGHPESADRPAAQHAGSARHDQSRQALRYRHPRRNRRPHAGDDARRPSGHALQEGRRAVRRDRPGHAARPLDAGRHQRHLCARARRRHGAALQSGRSVKEGVAPQSLNHFNRLRAVKVTGTLAPGYAIGEALQAMERCRQGRAAADRADRPRRPVARVPQFGRRDLLHVRARARVHLPRARPRSSRASSIRSSSC